jgi:hypothetical protein
VLTPPLRRALSVVRRIQSEPPAKRRALFANPRLYLREALGDEEETLIENVFRETPAYSDRVIGLGLWQPRVDHGKRRECPFLFVDELAVQARLTADPAPLSPSCCSDDHQWYHCRKRPLRLVSSASKRQRALT